MLDGVISLASYGGLSGGGIGNVLAQWESIGVFSYGLPFILLFAVIMGILTKSNIFGKDNKGLNVIIALAISLMALQFNFVGTFFSEIFPRLGVGLSILLVGLLLGGAFIDFDEGKNKYVKWIGGILALVLFYGAISKSFGWSSFGMGGTIFPYWIEQNLPTVLFVAALGVCIYFIINSVKGKK